MNLKEARSSERLMDETALFLHSKICELPEGKARVHPKTS